MAAKTARPVHYAAAGSGGLAFDCYIDAWRAHSDTDAPAPRAVTDLRKVTCADCWRAIGQMAQGFGRGQR